MKLVVTDIMHRAVLLIGISSIIAHHPALGQETSSLGSWTDTEGKVTYTFSENDEFLFRYEKRICVRNSNKPTGCEKYETRSASLEGTWKEGIGICRPGEKGEGRKEDIVVYVDDMYCCLSVRRLGNSLVLSETWTIGFAEASICIDRSLQRVSKPEGK